MRWDFLMSGTTFLTGPLATQEGQGVTSVCRNFWGSEFGLPAMSNCEKEPRVFRYGRRANTERESGCKRWTAPNAANRSEWTRCLRGARDKACEVQIVPLNMQTSAPSSGAR